MTVPKDTMAALAADGSTPAAVPVSAAAREKVKQLAQEFESLLMGQMLKEMRKSMLSEDENQEPGFGAANMTEMMDTALGAALTKAGGFGLADVMLRGIDRQFPTQRGGRLCPCGSRAWLRLARRRSCVRRPAGPYAGPRRWP